jgi:NAD+ diphosphatase
MLPEHFESALYLPFNCQSLQDDFQFLTPDCDPEPQSGVNQTGVWLVLQGDYLLVDEKTGELPREIPLGLNSPPLFIGLWHGQACRVVAYPRALACPPGMLALNLLADEPQMSIALLSLGALAQQLLNWQKDSLFCSACAAYMDFVPGEWGKKCRGCGRIHYPHVHPCIIVLITCGDEVLLTRKANWVAGRYGLVAGFVEPGECLEETLVREVQEETGVKVHNIKYICSQAWPFPSQIMMGFTADYLSGEVVVETNELEDARWFHRDHLPLLPSRRSIARFLLDNYL